jgi:hypothetical protein
VQGLLVTGLERPAADGRAGPFRQERTGALPCGPMDLQGHSIAGGTLKFFPESEWTHPPIGGLPHSTAGPGRAGGACAAVGAGGAQCDMN